MYERLMEATISPCGGVSTAAFNRRMRKTARPVVWEGDGAQSPSLDPIQKAWPHEERILTPMRSTLLALLLSTAAFAGDIESKVKHGYADSNGVKIHYASLG